MCQFSMHGGDTKIVGTEGTKSDMLELDMPDTAVFEFCKRRAFGML